MEYNLNNTNGHDILFLVEGGEDSLGISGNNTENPEIVIPEQIPEQMRRPFLSPVAKQRLETAAKVGLVLLILGGVGAGLYFLGAHYATQIKDFMAITHKMTRLEVCYKIILPIAGGALLIGLTAKYGKTVKDKIASAIRTAFQNLRERAVNFSEERETRRVEQMIERLQRHGIQVIRNQQLQEENSEQN